MESNSSSSKNSITTSDSAPLLDESWLLIKNTSDDEIGKHSENKSTEEMEDSDGISVISESEMYKQHNLNHSDSEMEKPHTVDEEEEDNEDEVDEEGVEANEEIVKNNNDEKSLASSSNEFEEEREEVKEIALKKHDGAVKEFESTLDAQRCQKSNHGVMLLIGMSLIIAVLYTNISSLKNEFAKTVLIYEQRIVRLEQENQILRVQLDDLMRKIQVSDTLKKDETPRSEDDVITNENYEMPIIQDTLGNFQKEEKTREPITKKVWIGGENEDVVKILDKKLNSLPDYCYFTDEDDLFYEYNKENCERKKQKMEDKIKKFQKFNNNKDKNDDNDPFQNEFKFTATDDIYKTSTDDENLNDFISKTTDEILQSLNDEIQEIKKSRFFSTDEISSFSKEINDQKDASSEDSKPSRKRKFSETNSLGDGSNKNKKKKRHPKNNKDSDEWIDRRTSGREAARKKNLNEDEENWFLKRKNDREIHRLETAHSKIVM